MVLLQQNQVMVVVVMVVVLKEWVQQMAHKYQTINKHQGSNESQSDIKTIQKFKNSKILH